MILEIGWCKMKYTDEWFKGLSDEEFYEEREPVR